MLCALLQVLAVGGEHLYTARPELQSTPNPTSTTVLPKVRKYPILLLLSVSASINLCVAICFYQLRAPFCRGSDTSKERTKY